MSTITTQIRQSMQLRHWNELLQREPPKQPLLIDGPSAGSTCMWVRCIAVWTRITFCPWRLFLIPHPLLLRSICSARYISSQISTYQIGRYILRRQKNQQKMGEILLLIYQAADIHCFPLRLNFSREVSGSDYRGRRARFVKQRRRFKDVEKEKRSYRFDSACLKVWISGAATIRTHPYQLLAQDSKAWWLAYGWIFE